MVEALRLTFVRAFTSIGNENVMRWDRTSTGFMEVWYVTANHRASGCGIWLRYTITSPRKGDPYCQLWGFLFDPASGPVFAARERFSVDMLGAPNGRDDGAIVRIGDAWLSESHLEGEVTAEGDAMSWSLDLEPASRCFRHIPVPLSDRIERRVSTICSPNLGVPFSGTVKTSERVLEFDGELGAQSHRWGRAHAATWAWSHCSRFDEGADAMFEAVSAKSSLGPIAIPTATFAYLRLDGEDLVFNDLRWALRARSTYEMPTWAFSVHNDSYKVVGATRANPARLIQVLYRDPDGSPRHCANSEVADLALEVYRRTGSQWTHTRSLTASTTAHVEFGRRAPFPELPLAF